MAAIYEAVYVFDAHLPEEKIDAAATRIEEFITAHGGSLRETNRWGKRRLAYEIKRKQHGVYFHFLFDADNTSIPNELNAQFNPKVVDFILRHLIVRVDPRQLEHDARRKERAAREIAEATARAEAAAAAEAAKQPAPDTAETDAAAADTTEAPAAESGETDATGDAAAAETSDEPVTEEPPAVTPEEPAPDTAESGDAAASEAPPAEEDGEKSETETEPEA